MGLGILIAEVSKSHSDTRNAFSRTRQDDLSGRRTDSYLHYMQNSEEKDIHATGGIRTRNPRMREAADPHRRLRGHRGAAELILPPFFKIRIVTRENDKD